MAERYGRWPWAQEPHELDILQVALMTEALAPVQAPTKSAEPGKPKPAKIRPLPKSTLAALEAKSHKNEGGGASGAESV